MSGTRRYRKLSAETLGTYYVKCAHCGYREAVHSLPPREKCTDSYK